jgi:O-antigen/teichoic acid export membrane protein
VSVDTLRSRVLSGLAWKAGSQILLQVSRLVVALVLARLLAPDDWGLAAMVLVFSGFVVVFTDNAFGTALIQRRDLRADDIATVFWTSAAIGVVLTVAGVVVAGPLASFYGDSDVRPLFAVLSLGFFVSALRTAQTALLVRDMSFRRLELAQMAATLIGAVTGISVAVGGYGAWAIVAQQLAETVTLTLLVGFLAPWRPTLRYSFTSLRRLSGFAGNVFAENLLYQAGRNVSALLIGRYLGAAAVGAYALATNVILVPFSRLAAPLQQVFFPAFSELSEDGNRLADVWIRASRLVGLVSIPALTGLAIVAPDFVDTVLGPKWEDATVVIQILACVGIVQSIQTLCGEVLLAVGRAGTLLRFTMLWFVASVAAFALGLQWGIVGVAACYAVATLLVEPVRTFMVTRALGIPLWAFFGAFVGIAQATLVMAAAVLATRALLVGLGTPAAARLVLVVLVGVAAYAGGCLWRAPEVTRELRGLVGGRRRTATSRVDPATGYSNG